MKTKRYHLLTGNVLLSLVLITLFLQGSLQSKKKDFNREIVWVQHRQLTVLHG
jgi:hypothetical protein